MGRLCGGAHEISGTKAPLFLHGGWLEGSLGGWVVVRLWLVRWVGVCVVVVVWVGLVVRVGGGWVGGWDGGVVGSGWGGDVHLIGKIFFVLRKNNMGGITGGVRCPCDAPHHKGHWGASDAPHDAPMLFFDNLVKKLDNLSTSNIDIYSSTMEICINNLLKPFFLWISTTPLPSNPTRDHPPNHTYAYYFQQKPTYLLTVNV